MTTHFQPGAKVQSCGYGFIYTVVDTKIYKRRRYLLVTDEDGVNRYYNARYMTPVTKQVAS